MNLDFDYIVIGSGFGGSVMTCRLVEKGYRVCLLERGQQWKMHEFPRRPDEIQKKLFWDPKDKKYGLMEFLDSPESDVISLTASGLGGGSLIYANVLLKMPGDFFQGWPGGINREKLEPYYDQVLKMMEAQPYPFEKDDYFSQTPKTAGLKKTASELEKAADQTNSAKFFLPPLAVRFAGDFPGHQSKNIHGAVQSKCNKCGECDLGCNIHAKNSLDLNYLFKATSTSNASSGPKKFELRTQAEVVRIEHIENHYKVTYVIPGIEDKQFTLTAKNVVLSAGSVGSSSLLLKMKQEGCLPKLNKWLGKKWSGNGDLLGMVLNTPTSYDPTKGPVITSAIEYRFQDYPDGYPHGMYIEDAGFPIGLAWYLSGKIPQFRGIWGTIKLIWRNIKNYSCKILGIKNNSAEINIGDDFAEALDKADFVRRSFMLLGMGRDRADGEIRLRNDNEPVIHWKMDKSALHFQRLRTEMKKIAHNMGGLFLDDPFTYLNKVIAVHPLGGCPMGDNEETGFVSPTGEVYGYQGLYVVDGAIIPTSVGPNPALTIAALAEMIADQIPSKIQPN